MTEDLKALRAELLAQQSELQNRVDKLERDLSQAKSADFAEQVTERENDDVLRELAREAKEEILKITHTLIRIDDDAYGYCDRCGKEISEKRLKAIPHADFCISCAEQLEAG